MTLKNIKVILVSREGNVTQAYLNAIKPFRVQVDTVSSFSELLKALIDTPYHGVMIDLKTKIAASKDEKELAHNILENLPVVQLRWEETTGMVRTLYYGQAKGGGTLEDFICEECASVSPRTIRSSPRKNINFNVILSKTANLSGNHNERSITINVSKEGCFIYSSSNWEGFTDAWFIIKELSGNTPIHGEVRWKISWGKTMQIPGIGVKFEDIRKGQLKEICDRHELPHRDP